MHSSNEGLLGPEEWLDRWKLSWELEDHHLYQGRALTLFSKRRRLCRRRRSKNCETEQRKQKMAGKLRLYIQTRGL
jgi:hypothetical protein